MTEAAALVIDALATTGVRWLLIYDNANEPDDLAPLIPSSGGHVVLTSRRQTWPVGRAAIEVYVFDRAESIALVRRRDESIPVGDADRLAGTLGDLPLALDQASAWLLATRMGVAAYLDLFDRHYRALLAGGAAPNYPTVIAALIKLILAHLR